jgi:hypothetical protein
MTADGTSATSRRDPDHRLGLGGRVERIAGQRGADRRDRADVDDTAVAPRPLSGGLLGREASLGKIQQSTPIESMALIDVL